MHSHRQRVQQHVKVKPKAKLKQIAEYFHVLLANACSPFHIQHLTLNLSTTIASEGFHS